MMAGEIIEYSLRIKENGSGYVVVRFDDPKPSLPVKGRERIYREMKLSYLDFHVITIDEKVELNVGEKYGYNLEKLREIVVVKFPPEKNLERILDEEVIELKEKDMVKLDKEMEIIDDIEAEE